MVMEEVADNSVEEGAKQPHKPVVYAPTDGLLCDTCRELEKTFFDVNCAGCQQLLDDETTTVSQLFAVLRQWIPQTQQNILMIIEQVTTVALD